MPLMMPFQGKGIAMAYEEMWPKATGTRIIQSATVSERYMERVGVDFSDRIIKFS